MLDKQGWGWRWKGRVTKKWLSWLPDGYQKSKIQKRRKMLALPELPRLPTKLSYIEKKK